MENFFRNINKVDINTTYHNPYKFITAETNVRKISKRIGDFDTTLWFETTGLILFMSLLVLIPTLI